MSDEPKNIEDKRRWTHKDFVAAIGDMSDLDGAEWRKRVQHILLRLASKAESQRKHFNRGLG